MEVLGQRRCALNAHESMADTHAERKDALRARSRAEAGLCLVVPCVQERKTHVASTGAWIWHEKHALCLCLQAMVEIARSAGLLDGDGSLQQGSASSAKCSIFVGEKRVFEEAAGRDAGEAGLLAQSRARPSACRPW